ncbi:MAG TPA: histidine triad nucleotide-binding protein [Bacilli bacterium]
MSDCIFCKIVKGELPAKKVLETDDVLVFHDIEPAAPVHVLIIPKKHIASLNDAGADDWAVIGKVHEAAQKAAEQLGVAQSGYRLINNCGKDSGQVVFHIHYHLLGGEKLGPLNAK